MAQWVQGKTAMARSDASRPIKIAVEHTVLRPDRSFFDYGCGRGGDVSWLKNSGWRARGWDPVHRPRTRRTKSDTVGLTYVLNVIEGSARAKTNSYICVGVDHVGARCERSSN